MSPRVYTVLAILVTLVALVALAAIGGYTHWSGTRDGTGGARGARGAPVPVDAAPAPDPQLVAELAAARREAEQLRAELDRLHEAARVSAAEPPSPPTVPVESFVARGGAGRVIKTLEEAEPAFERAVAAGDLETLWLLGADLLALGEDAYPLFEKLLDQFFASAEGNPAPFGEEWEDEELWMGRFFRTLAEEHESFLAFGLHLARSDADAFGPALQRLRHDILDDELLPVLLAFHGGENAELTAAWLDLFEAHLELPDLGGIDEETLVYCLAQIPEDRAAELLARWIEMGGGHRDEAIRALVLQGSPSALAALRSLLPTIEDEALRAAVERRLGG
jgi:hypothetical protein